MSQDLLHRFSFRTAPIRGQWVRLEGVLDEMLQRQNYPSAVRVLLAEMMAAVSLMADGIKFKGAVALQSRGSGPVTTGLAECRDQKLLRGIARWEGEIPEAHTNEAPAEYPTIHYGELADLIGEGRMAITLTPMREKGRDNEGGAPDLNSYQGVVSLESGSLAANLEAYFANSEQLPTRLFFAFARDTITGLLLQRLPTPDNATEVELEHQDQGHHGVEQAEHERGPGQAEQRHEQEREGQAGGESDKSGFQHLRSSRAVGVVQPRIVTTIIATTATITAITNRRRALLLSRACSLRNATCAQGLGIRFRHVDLCRHKR